VGFLCSADTTFQVVADGVRPLAGFSKQGAKQVLQVIPGSPHEGKESAGFSRKTEANHCKPITPTLAQKSAPIEHPKGRCWILR